MDIKKAITVLVPAISFAFSLHAQKNEEASLGQVINKFYSVLSFRDTNAIRLDSMTSLFTIDGRLIAAYGTEPMSWSAPDFVGFIRRSIPAQQITSRTETELSRKIEVFGNIAHVFSTYELTVQAKGQALTRRGINSIQLIKQNGGWYISSLTWDRESDTLQLPLKYLQE